MSRGNETEPAGRQEPGKGGEVRNDGQADGAPGSTEQESGEAGDVRRQAETAVAALRTRMEHEGLLNVCAEYDGGDGTGGVTVVEAWTTEEKPAPERDDPDCGTISGRIATSPVIDGLGRQAAKAVLAQVHGAWMEGHGAHGAVDVFRERVMIDHHERSERRKHTILEADGGVSTVEGPDR